MGSNQAALHSEVLTGQTHGVYQDASGGTGYFGYSGGGNNDNLGFGSFASFFRNYKYAPTTEELMVYLDSNNAMSYQGAEDVGQYRFDDTTDTEWKGELGYHTAPSYFNSQTQNSVSLKNADHSGFDDNERYGVFNNDGEQEKGNVWFIDGGPFTGTRNSYDSIHWQHHSSGNGNELGISNGYMVIAMGGIYYDGIDTNGDGNSNVFNIGSTDNSFYNSQKFKDLIDKISPSLKFRFREDPTGEVYTIKPSGVTYRNKLRWSDGNKMSTSSGELRAYVTGGNAAAALTPQLSPNITRGYKALFTNDRTNGTQLTWDPTNGGVTGAISQGLNLTVTHANFPLTLNSRQVFVEDIHNITCSVNGGKHSITKGMILTSYGGVTLDGTFTNPGTTNSHEPLIVSDIDQGQGGGFVLTLTGYSSPILVSGNLANTGLLQHKIFDTSPTTGDDLVFQQPAMNGYSQYSVNRINAQDPEGGGIFNLNNPALLAVGYTIEFLEEIEKESEFPDNPAIWETEPKETTDLDIYYEASGYNPLVLTDETVNFVLPRGSGITHVQNPTTNLGMSNSTDAAISAVGYNEVADPMLANSGDITGWYITIIGAIVTSGSIWNGTFSFTAETPLVGGNYINIGDQLLISKPDGSSITVTVKGWNWGDNNNRAAVFFIEDALSGPNTKYTLNWHNCYSFGNGVESNRIRDTYNLAYIANGVKASTTLDEHPYEENLKYGLIYSGIYNGSVGINNLNQFIAAEKISKDLNPTYGSIQKLKAGWGQGGDLITLCEDRVLKIMANKDALYNADGNPQLLATNAVLGQAIPYSGEYGISTNPESFASEAYRAYFTDKVRGAVMRLSMDGLTPISNAGMKDWFRDNLKLSNKLIGSYDDRQDEYNVSLEETTENVSKTVSYKEDVKGWVSFKSFIKETGISCANGYYTFANGRLWEHHTESAEDVLTATITGVDHINDTPDPTTGEDRNGKYFFFELSELESIFPGIPTGWTSYTATMKQHRNGTFVRQAAVDIFGGGGNSLLANSPSGGDTKGHGRLDVGSAYFQWEVGDTITIGNWDRNTFYDTFTNSSLNVLLNDMPSSIKSYHTLEYEGSQSRVLNYSTMSVVNEFGNTVALSDAEAHNLTAKDGWYVDNVETNKQEGSLREFIEKEGKWFNYIKGVDSSIGETTDFGSLNIQGIGSGSRGHYIADVVTGVGGIVSVISFDNEINLSLQVGDTVYANDTLTSEAFFQTIDTANAVNCGTVMHVGSSWEDFISNYDEELWVEMGATPLMWNYNDGSVDVSTLTNPYQTANIVVVSQQITPVYQPDSYYFFTKNQVINTSSLSGYYADVQFQNNSIVKAEIFAVSSEVTESSK